MTGVEQRNILRGSSDPQLDSGGKFFEMKIYLGVE
jgi:hypothetical protein